MPKGRTDDAIAVLQQRADAGDQEAAERLTDLLAVHRRIDEFGREVVAGGWSAAGRLVELRR